MASGIAITNQLPSGPHFHIPVSHEKIAQDRGIETWWHYDSSVSCFRLTMSFIVENINKTSHLRAMAVCYAAWVQSNLVDMEGAQGVEFGISADGFVFQLRCKSSSECTRAVKALQKVVEEQDSSQQELENLQQKTYASYNQLEESQNAAQFLQLLMTEGVFPHRHIASAALELNYEDFTLYRTKNPLHNRCLALFFGGNISSYDALIVSKRIQGIFNPQRNAWPDPVDFLSFVPGKTLERFSWQSSGKGSPEIVILHIVEGSSILIAKAYCAIARKQDALFSVSCEILPSGEKTGILFVASGDATESQSCIDIQVTISSCIERHLQSISDGAFQEIMHTCLDGATITRSDILEFNTKLTTPVLTLSYGPNCKCDDFDGFRSSQRPGNEDITYPPLILDEETVKARWKREEGCEFFVGVTFNESIANRNVQTVAMARLFTWALRGKLQGELNFGVSWKGFELAAYLPSDSPISQLPECLVEASSVALNEHQFNNLRTSLAEQLEHETWGKEGAGLVFNTLTTPGTFLPTDIASALLALDYQTFQSYLQRAPLNGGIEVFCHGRIPEADAVNLAHSLREVFVPGRNVWSPAFRSQHLPAQTFHYKTEQDSYVVADFFKCPPCESVIAVAEFVCSFISSLNLHLAQPTFITRPGNIGILFIAESHISHMDAENAIASIIQQSQHKLASLTSATLEDAKCAVLSHQVPTSFRAQTFLLWSYLHNTRANVKPGMYPTDVGALYAYVNLLGVSNKQEDYQSITVENLATFLRQTLDTPTKFSIRLGKNVETDYLEDLRSYSQQG